MYQLIDSVFSDSQMFDIGDDRRPKKNPLNSNFDKQEFKELWKRINRKAAYSVDFDSAELVTKAVTELDKSLRVTPLQYTIQTGEQVDQVTADALKSGDGFKVAETTVEYNKQSIHSAVKYDLIGEVAEKTQLTRRTVAEILGRVAGGTFTKFRLNPEQFITEAARLINEQKATVIVEHLTYDALEDRFDSAIFTENQTAQDLTKAGDRLKKSVYEYVVTDSKVERSFVEQLDVSDEVVVYSKLPRGFFIPTPVGDYNPDWAIAFRDDITQIKHVYFVAETKGSMSTLQLKGVEQAKIECARKFFTSLNDKAEHEGVKYDVVDTYENLLALVGE